MIQSRRGFTLIELLIVVVIIGILASIAIPKFANTKTKAYATAMKSDLRNLVTAEEAFFADSGHYAQWATGQMDTTRFKMSTDVSAPSITVSGGSWHATVTHSQLTNPLVTCEVAVNTTNVTVPTAGEGEPACK